MKLTLEGLSAQLDERLLPIYLVSGDEPLLVGEASDAIRARARALGFAEREVFFIERGNAVSDEMVAELTGIIEGAEKTSSRPIVLSPMRMGAASRERMPRARQLSRSTRSSVSASSQRDNFPDRTHSPEKPEPTCRAAPKGGALGPAPARQIIILTLVFVSAPASVFASLRASATSSFC